MKLTRISAALGALLLTLGMAGTAFASHTIDLGASGTDQSGQCTGDYFKIESAGILEEGTHDYEGTTKDGEDFSANLTVVFDDDNQVESIDVNDTDPDTIVFVIKAGDEFFWGEHHLLTPGNGHAISNVAFCLDDPSPTPTPTPTPEPTPTPTPEPTPTPTPDATPTPTPDATPTPTPDATPTPTPEDSVGGETGTPPSVTLPPTDALDGSAVPGTSAWAVLAVVLAGIVASVFVLTPSRRRR